MRYPHPATLLDYFEDPLLILEAPGDIAEAQRATRFRRQEEQKGLLEAGVLAPGLDGYYLDLDWLYVQAGRCRTLVGDNFTRSLPDLKLKALVDVSCHALPSWNGEVPALLEDLEPLLKQGYCAAVLAGTQRLIKPRCQNHVALGVGQQQAGIAGFADDADGPLHPVPVLFAELRQVLALLQQADLLGRHLHHAAEGAFALADEVAHGEVHLHKAHHRNARHQQDGRGGEVHIADGLAHMPVQSFTSNI